MHKIFKINMKLNFRQSMIMLWSQLKEKLRKFNKNIQHIKSLRKNKEYHLLDLLLLLEKQRLKDNKKKEKRTLLYVKEMDYQQRKIETLIMN